MFKNFIIFLTICLFFVSCTLGASTKPAAIIASVGIESSNTGYFYPDIVIQSDGCWREGTSNDLFIGQTFTIFSGPKNEKLSTKFKIEKNSNELPVPFSNKAKFKPGFRYWAYHNNTNSSFKLKGIEKLIEPKRVNSSTLNQFQKNISNFSIENIISIDFNDIGNDFDIKISKNILQYSQGDINGDSNPDYVVALGKGYGLPGEGIAVILYVSDKNYYKRISVKSWKNKSEYLSGPSSFVFKDVNNDKAEELFLIDSDSDCSYPIVYSWFGKGIQKVYAGKTELWGGF